MADIDSQFSDSPPGELIVNCPKSGAPIKTPVGCEYLDKPYTVEAPEADFDRIRKPATLDAGTATTHQFPGDASATAATKYVADVGGHKVPFLVPDPPPPGKNLPTAAQVAKALGAVPGKQLDTIQQIEVSPNPN